MRATVFIMAALLALASAQQTYQLVWSDEFNGNSLDLSKWQYEVNCDGGGNAELQCYTNSANNLAVTNGSLVITAMPQNINGKQYSSARINTAASAAWKYGRIDFSAKLPNGIYLWPALWMMPRDSVYGSWAASGEIDIMETRSTQNTQESTLHFGGGWPYNIYQGSGPQTMSFDMTAAYHLYSAIWTPTSIQFLVDNNVYYTQTLQRNFWNPANPNPSPYTTNGQPFDQYFYIVMNLAIGGGFFGGNANSLTLQQAQAWANPKMYIDYVRVYQLQNSVTPNQPTPSPSQCVNMFASLQCRTITEDPTQVDSASVSNSRNWLCGNYPQFCSAINNGGQYSGCNAVEQLSYAMNLYYTQFQSQGAGACSFGGIGQVVSQNAATTSAATPTPATSAPSSSNCASMFAGLSCRTASQNPAQVDASGVTNSRNWLCGTYPQFCTAINSGGQYSGCNAVEQLSYAMSQYYNQYGPTQGASACSFGGIGNVVSNVQQPATKAPTTAAATPAPTTSSSSAAPCARAGYCASNMCACNGACYNSSQYCCVNNGLVQAQFCPK